MFQVTAGGNKKSGLVIDLGNAYPRGKHLRMYPNDKEGCVEALKHYFNLPHNKEICTSCLDDKK